MAITIEVARLLVPLVATTDQFQKQLGGASKFAKKWAGGIQVAGKLAMAGIGAGAAIAATAVTGVGVALGKLALEAAPLEGIESAFEAISKRSGMAADVMLKSLEDTSAGMVAQRDLMKSFNQAASLVSDQFATRLPEAMGVLTKVSAATGQSMDYMMDSLVKGVGRVSPLILDNLGIQMDMNKALEDYAEKHGVAAMSTVDHSKKISDITQKMGYLEQEVSLAEQAFHKENAELIHARDVWAAGSNELKGFEMRVEKADLALKKKTDKLVSMQTELGKLQSEHGKTSKTTGDLTKVLSKSEQQMALYEQVISKLEEKYEDMPPVTKSFATSVAAMGAKFQNFKDTLGKAVLPIASKVMAIFVELADKAMPLVTDFMETMLLPLLDKLVESLEWVFDKLMSGQFDIEAFRDVLAQFLPMEVINKVYAFGESILKLIETVRPYVEQVAAWIAKHVELKDILIAVGIAIAVFIASALYPIIAAAAGIVAAFVGLIAIIAALRAAWETDWMGIRTALTEFWENTAKPALQELWQWLQVNIPVAIQTLKGFWEDTLLPALQTVWAFIQESVLPLFSKLWDWLQVSIPAALQTLADFWNNTLLPALETSWDFFENSIMPVLAAVADVMEAVLGKAIEVLAGLWQNVLYPALEAVWDILEPKLMPLLEKLGSETGPAVASAFEKIGEFLGTVAEKLGEFADKIRGLELPEWLKPGSATPFELGLIGIAQAVLERLIPAFREFLTMLMERWAAFGSFLLEESWPMLQEGWLVMLSLMGGQFEALVNTVLAGAQTMVKAINRVTAALGRMKEATKGAEAAIRSLTGKSILARFDKLIGKVNRLIKRMEALEKAAEAAMKAAGGAKGGGGGGEAPSPPPPAQRGIWNVPRTMAATLHRGERVLPAGLAAASRTGLGGTTVLAPVFLDSRDFVDAAGVVDYTRIGQRLRELEGGL